MLKILVADKYNIHRIGMVQILLEAFPDAVVEEANDPDILLTKLVGYKWDIVISGFILPVDKGIDAIQKIKNLVPGTPIAVCGLETQTNDINLLLKAGASEFIDKSARVASIVEQIKKILLSEE